MSSKQQTHFFALKEDWESVFENIEESIDLKYVLAGNFVEEEQPNPIEYSKISLIPNIGIAKGSQQSSYDQYIVFYKDDNIVFRKFNDHMNRKRYAIDQMLNQKTMEITFGGLYKNEAIISGRIATIHTTDEALKLMKVFRKYIYKFKKINAFYVGPMAYKIFKEGFRLACCSVDSPKEYDLLE